MIGKPDSGKPTVRFDEGELEIEPKVTTPVLYSTGIEKNSMNSTGGMSQGMIESPEMQSCA